MVNGISQRRLYGVTSQKNRTTSTRVRMEGKRRMRQTLTSILGVVEIRGDTGIRLHSGDED